MKNGSQKDTVAGLSKLGEKVYKARQRDVAAAASGPQTGSNTPWESILSEKRTAEIYAARRH